MKEIGGYFGLDVFSGKEYHKDLTALNSGRNALAYLIRARHIKKLHIPYFLCDSIAGVCDREKCPVEYYHINQDFLPLFDGTLSEGDWMYIVNYYGQINNGQVLQMKSRWKNIIFDNVQAFFQRPVACVDTIYSCRKFFGVPDGAYLSTDAVLKEELALDKSADRMRHILGRYEGSASDYHSDFKQNDASFRELPLLQMSKLTENLLRAIDYEKVIAARNANWKILHEALGDKNSLNLRCPSGPYAYPFYCQDGMEIKKKLAQQKIYVATLWPNVLQMEGSLEKDYAENILPLPCDQRYDVQDMKVIIEAVIRCLD